MPRYPLGLDVELGRRPDAHGTQCGHLAVWKEPRRATPIDNVIDVQMTRLRRKVDTEGTVRLIHTVRGVGFTLQEGEP